jgi:hypothetical protein
MQAICVKGQLNTIAMVLESCIQDILLTIFKTNLPFWFGVVGFRCRSLTDIGFRIPAHEALLF